MSLRLHLGRLLQSLAWWLLGRCARCGGEVERGEALSLFPPTVCKKCGWISEDEHA